ncbi:MAG: acyl-CoA dehydrogenase C-terminal domain-containing protein [Rhodospirillales bacterium]|nr:acyl-CoA dehydrogenase C-terminal domain-containing protein [Rhodospirillales bacterium]
MTYAAPVDDMRFVINELADLRTVAALPGCEEVTPDLVDAILEEAGKFGAEVLAPINAIGDSGCRWDNGVVRTPEGFCDAYQQFVDGGWNSVPFDPDYGGQGLPWLVSTAVSEVWHAANMAFGLCPMLSQGASELLHTYGSDALKDLYLPKMISGEWTGTMNLTESQAGSDLAAVRTRSIRDGDNYRIVGQKIFITHGEHDMAENIIHMVLARSPDGPAGVGGLSLFLVPKFIPNPDGSLGDRNDLRCVSIEHKLGINGSPTAVMSFGDDGGAVGYLIGQENAGLAQMFLMMNNARLAVGLEGVGIAERAYQLSRAYALERVQGRMLGGDDPSSVAIAHHPDVQRMLLSMKSQTEAARALAYYVGACIDVSNRHTDESTRRRFNALVGLLTPVVKGWSTEIGIEVANTGIQVHGGMGYIEESGAPQHLRDARIAAIYEGTNGIQANDLVGRKVARENGATVTEFIAMVRELDKELATGNSEDLKVIRAELAGAVSELANATEWLLKAFPADPRRVAAGSMSYMMLLGYIAGGWLMARAALCAERRLTEGDGSSDFYRAKLVTARFYADTCLTKAASLRKAFERAGAALSRLDPERHL